MYDHPVQEKTEVITTHRVYAPTLALPGEIEGRSVDRKASEVIQEYPVPSIPYIY